ncbi:unnamed protein product [Cyclocybe aegerita]|uniref:FAD-binding PCMH-type domain-containing protein n=1 Tax=Cyclocybe aegerita TaxID=1973307 RepID=A0A8S0XS18_CYCAE|nr:unnamed protein product [Cyclocybe aegerita]
MSEIDTTKFAFDFKGDIITPGHPAYTTAISRRAQNAARKAKVVAFVKDNQDVVHALKFAQENKLPIAVRGGGHNAAGASSIEGGFVIYLSRYLNGARVDTSKKLAYVGGGAVWEAVDKAAIKHGLATVGGTVNHTGVGGLVLGGGYGWLTASYGLATDNLIQVTIVTADGSILTVNETENPDLYFAVRGGGGNFGVVTEFVLRLHPQRPTVYSGIVVYPAKAAEKLHEASEKWWKQAADDESMLKIVTVDPDGKAIIAVLPFYNGIEAEGRERFKGIIEAGLVKDMSKEIPYEELNSLQNPLAKHGSGVYMKGVALRRVHLPSFVKAHKRLAEIISGGVFRGAITYEFFGLKKVNAVPIDATAFRREMAGNVLINILWDVSQDRTEEARKLTHELCAIVLEGQQGISESESLGYSNYDHDTAISDKAKLVFGANYPRLQGIKKRYDPDNVFDRWFPITPA